MNATTIAVAIATSVLSISAAAQTTTTIGPGTAGSPHVKTEWKINGATISITYGRPSLKGRAEGQMMPAGKPWRTGADEATVLTTDKPLKFGGVSLAAGSYTLNTQPGDKEWQLLLGTLKAPGQWGIPYQAALELGKVPMKLGKASAPAEQVTYSIDKSAKGGTLRIEWGTVSVTTPFTIG